MTRWERFLASLSCEGGHIFVWWVIIWTGVLLVKFGIAKGEDAIVAGITGIGIALKSSFDKSRPTDAA